MSSNVEISTDGSTVWVNGPTALLGRFSRMGVDVHIGGVCAGEGCVPGPCTIDHWRLFQVKMIVEHRVRVSDAWMPEYLK